MLISSIIKRYHNTYSSPLNVIMTSCENKAFDLFIRKSVIQDGVVLSFEDSLFGNMSLDMIICHNKITQLEKCINLAYFFHCPVLVIDHEQKPSYIDKDIMVFQSNSIFSVALNFHIYNSWDKYHNLVMGFDIKDKDNIDSWKNLLYQITKIPFNIKEKIPYEEPRE